MKVDNLWAIIPLNKKKINIFLFLPQIVVFQFFLKPPQSYTTQGFKDRG